MKYLYWRGRSLWCRFPFPGKPEMYSLGIKRASDSKTEFKRCLAEGEKALAALRTRKVENRFFDSDEERGKEPYEPTFCAIAMRYWFYHLRMKKSGMNERYHLAHSVKRFGRILASEVDRESIVLWMNEMVRAGASVNAVNNRFAYLKAVFKYANSESRQEFQISHNPTAGIKKLPGGKVRQFVLTEERFERNYEYLRQMSPDFSLYYLALWETGRRPVEVSRYEWRFIDFDRQVIMVPGELTKTDETQDLPISWRLLGELMRIPGHQRTGLIFRNGHGRRWRDPRHHMHKLEIKFGKEEVGWRRDTRRGFVTHKCEVLKCDPAHVKQFSGHKTHSIFERYRINQIDNLRDVANKSIRTNSVQIDGKTSKTA